ncbi:hypothetical protein SAMN05880570_2206 [Paenibacillus sp. RU4T]|nr:hypothetical protein SAMN05880555_2207 [Paenibacillus sp. RU4X]SIQ96438.1 hypothetical protein SAMN05880570_2206 [Paenibacillus sp. RU4T]
MNVPDHAQSMQAATGGLLFWTVPEPEWKRLLPMILYSGSTMGYDGEERFVSTRENRRLT